LIILIVDDNQRMRGIIKNLLTAPGIDCIECENGAQAIQKFRELQPDWVLMDVIMPGMNGFETSRNIIAEFPDAHIVIVTDYDDKEFRSTAEQIGAKGYILKEELIKLRDICSVSNL